MSENEQIQDKELIIELHYEKGKDNPVKIFESCKLMLESVIYLQKHLVENIHCSLKTDFFLTNIKSASLFTKFLRKIIHVEEETVFCNEPIGEINQYVDQSTTLIAQRIADSKHSPIQNGDIIELKKQINNIAKETKIDQNPNYQSPNATIIADTCEMAKKATDLLSTSDSFDVIYEKQTPITLSHIQTVINKQNLLQQEENYQITQSNLSTTLIIKTADFLGNSKWKFITRDGKTIDAKIEDNDWLEIFHNNSMYNNLNMSLSSGDALDIEGVLKETHDQFGALIDEEYTITKVKDIIHNDSK